MTLSSPEIETREIEAVDFDELMNPFEEDDGSDPNRKAHYVTWEDNPEFVARFGQMRSAELVSTARLHRVEVVALCGYKWVPKLKPQQFDVCSRCVDVAANRITGG
jgi:hypothetical protein